jgi:hypothetical protein
MSQKQPKPCFRNLGVSLEFLEEFLNNLFPEGREAFEHLSTHEVCEELIKPVTVLQNLSLCEVLEQRKCSEIGEATVFVSHVWQYRFLDLVDSLILRFSGLEPPKRAKVRLWIDVFSVNQHLLGDTEWSLSEFKELVADIGHTALVLASTADHSWETMPALRRTWCLWELHCTELTQTDLSFCLSPEIVIRKLCRWVCFDTQSVIVGLCAIVHNSETDSQCSFPQDKAKLMETILKEDGLHGIKSIVISYALENLDLLLAAMRYEDLVKKEQKGPKPALVSEDILLCYYSLAQYYFSKRMFKVAQEAFEMYFEDLADQPAKLWVAHEEKIKTASLALKRIADLNKDYCGEGQRLLILQKLKDVKEAANTTTEEATRIYSDT